MSDNKVVIITGSSSGIGRETAHLFASKGFQVVVHGSKSQEKVNKVVDECNKLAPTSQHKSFGIVADFQDPSNGQLVAKRAYEHYGRIDAVICNAGVYIETNYTNIQDCRNNYRRLMDVNLNSHLCLLLEAALHLKKVDNASIVIISDVVVDRPLKNLFGYTMTRAALKSLAQCCAVEFAPKIRSISVTISGVISPRNEKFISNNDDKFSKLSLLERNVSMKEIAENLWHLSQVATYINGTNICIDGGYTIKREFSYS